ncbi:hypothetical protein [Patulibacter sp.]|uniref:hypothetical protein n=1 Tax=Patulibacter sp. TaxID=1912859 RepID=UPI00272637A7|nr:hypothetical protein [Patulibacter sp.]MDO9408266.1 hypothetical protein [Patulibacter sp.]
MAQEHDHTADPSCPNGVCSASAPPLIGSILTGSGLTLDRAVQLLQQGAELPLTDVQLRIVEERALRVAG